jgi:Pentapeptide repeats (9 copies)
VVCNAWVEDRADAGRVAQLPLTVNWLTCEMGDCLGARVGAGNQCWAHLSGEGLEKALASLRPGGRSDARGTVLSERLVRQLLAAMGDAKDHQSRVTDADFTGARFLGNALFDDVIFAGRTCFTNATFETKASFYGAKFGHYVSFHEATFNGWADFQSASFGQAAFKRIEFAADASFEDVAFGRLVEFVGVQFRESAEFNGMSAGEEARFLICRFDDNCNFQRARFYGSAGFRRNTFTYDSNFNQASFSNEAHFTQNEFSGDVMFAETVFYDHAEFSESIFRGNALFIGTVFSGMSNFEGARFSENVSCQAARFHDAANFGSAQAAGRMWLESAGGHGELTLDGLSADGVVEVTGSFAKVSCADAVLRGRTWFRLTGSELWLDNSEFTAPVTVESRALPASSDAQHLTVVNINVSKSELARLRTADNSGFPAQAITTSRVLRCSSVSKRVSPTDGQVRLRSLHGTDAEHLTLVDVDLSRCEIAGLRRPESLRLVGRCRFAPMPRGLCMRWRWLPWRWSTREALFEEHVWRRSIRSPAPGHGWEKPDSWQEIDVRPDRLAVMYRQLRVVLENGRNEPGAADLYYGEMEMRRAASQVRGERSLLWMYWLVSGYGLRAVRSLCVLAVVILAAAAMLRYVGFPGVTPGYPECVVYAGGAVLSLNLASQHLPGVLTEWGNVVRIGLRVAGPVLLGLAALAVRGRVKR